MSGRLVIINKMFSNLKFSINQQKSPLFFLIPKVAFLSFIIALFMRLMGFLPLLIAWPEETNINIFFNFSFYSYSEGNIVIFIFSSLWVTLRLVLLAWLFSIILGISIIYIKSRYSKYDFLWNFLLAIGGIHVFGLIVIAQHLVSGYIPFTILVFVLAIGSGSLKDMVSSFESIYKDVKRKEYWRFMFSQGVPQFRIGFSELLVRFTELSFSKLPILFVGSILVEAAANKQGLGYHLLNSLKAIERGNVDLNILTGVAFTMIFLVLLSQHIAEYVRIRFAPQSLVKR